MRNLLILLGLFVSFNIAFAGDNYLVCEDPHLDLFYSASIDEGKAEMNLVMPEGEKVKIFLTETDGHEEAPFFVKIISHPDAPATGIFLKYFDIFYIGQYECLIRD